MIVSKGSMGLASEAEFDKSGADCTLWVEVKFSALHKGICNVLVRMTYLLLKRVFFGLSNAHGHRLPDSSRKIK